MRDKYLFVYLALVAVLAVVIMTSSSIKREKPSISEINYINLSDGYIVEFNYETGEVVRVWILNESSFYRVSVEILTGAGSNVRSVKGKISGGVYTLGLLVMRSLDAKIYTNTSKDGGYDFSLVDIGVSGEDHMIVDFVLVGEGEVKLKADTTVKKGNVLRTLCFDTTFYLGYERVPLRPWEAVTSGLPRGNRAVDGS